MWYSECKSCCDDHGKAKCDARQGGACQRHSGPSGHDAQQC